MDDITQEEILAHYNKLIQERYGSRIDLLKVKTIRYLNNILQAFKLQLLRRKDISKKCFIGVGGGGSNILHDISMINDNHTFIHINSDNNALRQKQSDYKILLTSDSKKDKWGCGGNTDCGLSLVDESVKETIKKFTENDDTVYLIATLGGGVGSGSTPEIAKYLKGINKKVITYTTLPFTFEGKVRLRIAHDSLKELELYSDKSIVIDNNRIAKSKKGLRESFKIISIDIYKQII